MRENELSLRATWDKGTLGAHFNQEPATMPPNRHGHEGYRLLIPPTDDPEVAVTLYPESNLVRVQTRETDVQVRSVAEPRLTTSGMLIETTDAVTQLLITKTGGVAMQVFPTPPAPPAALESPTGIPDMPNEALTVLPDTTPPGASGEQIRPSDDSSPTATTESKEKQPTVKVTGNVLRPPSYKPASDGTPRMLFQLAEHPDPNDRDKTVCHYVYSTGTWATKIQDKNLQVGEPVRVSGYMQSYEARNRAGQIEQRERIFAIHVQQLRRKQATSE